MSWLHTLERRLPFLAAPHVLLAFIIGQVFFYLAAMLQMVDLGRFSLIGAAILGGEWWRAFSYPFLPGGQHVVFFALAVYCLYMFGSAVEREWGTLRLNLFLLSGWLLTLAVAFVLPRAELSNVFLTGTLFLVFARQNPFATVYVLFVLPVQVRFIAYVVWGLYALQFAFGDMPARLLILAATGNFFLFCGRELWQEIRTNRRHARHLASRREERREADAAGPRHRCAACAKTSDSHPDEDFRYRADGTCYCSEHLRN
jgi:membrane associated rhomboid family serine protease